MSKKNTYHMALTNASKARSVLAKGFKSRQYKRHAHVAASTKPVNLEKKRNQMQESIDQIAFLSEAIFNPATADEEKAKFFNMANLVMMRGFLQAKGLDADISTLRLPCTIRKKDGTKTKGWKRRSIAELLAVEEDDGDLSSAAEVMSDIRAILSFQINLVTRIFFPMFNEIGEKFEAWHDRDGIPAPSKYTDMMKEFLEEGEEGVVAEEIFSEEEKEDKKPLSVEAIKESLVGKKKEEKPDAGSSDSSH